jgi:hypothetical protein
MANSEWRKERSPFRLPRTNRSAIRYSLSPRVCFSATVVSALRR